MTVTVPVNSPTYPVSAEITNLKALIAATSNVALKVALQVRLVAAQVVFVDALMAHGAVPASWILSNATYGSPDTNAI
jgi:hypothetical protein